MSQGIYAGLNGGTGSRDDQSLVAQNRARMEAALGVPEGHLLTAWQVHSPDCVVVDRRLGRAAPRRRGRHRHARHRRRRLHRRLRPGAVRGP